MRRNFLLNVLLRDRIHRFIYMSKCCSIISLVLLTGAPLSLSTTVHLTSNVATGTPYAGAGRKSLSPLHLLTAAKPIAARIHLLIFVMMFLIYYQMNGIILYLTFFMYS